MSLLNTVIKAFVGDKSKKDVKELQPLVEQINSHGAVLESLSNDELRQKTADLKEKISEDCAAITTQINDLMKIFMQRSIN